VRLQSLAVEPGPDYHVHVVPRAERKSPDGGVHLNRLRGNKGNQNYRCQRRSAYNGRSPCSSGAGPSPSRSRRPPSADDTFDEGVTCTPISCPD
jgi:hypothetical protein